MSGKGKKSKTHKFSRSQKAGSPVAPCPLKCNLKVLKILEPNGGSSDKKIKREVDIYPDGVLKRDATPTLIPSGAKFQITANSKLAKEPRELKFAVVTQANCPGKKHPQLSWKDSSEDKQIVGTTGEGKYYRQDLACDQMGGFFSILNSVFALGSKRTYMVAAESCGKPPDPKGIPAPRLAAIVEVFPGDQFEAEFEFPAAKKIEGPEGKSESWTTNRDRQGEEIKKEGDEAAAGYQQSSPTTRAAWGSEADYRKGFEDKKKEDLGYKDREHEHEWKAKLTQKDGSRTAEAKLDELVKLYKLARSVERQIKQIQEWVEDIQIGPGASFKAEIEIFVASLKGEWGYQEYTDDRVYMAVTASFSAEIIKGSIEAFFGFRSAGLADVLAFIKGEGALKVTAQIKHDNPDHFVHPDVAVAGEFKLSGGVQGQALWVMKAEGKLQSGFSLELQHIKIFQETAMLQGEFEIKLAATQLVLTASCMGWGSKARTYELIKEKKWSIPVGE